MNVDRRTLLAGTAAVAAGAATLATVFSAPVSPHATSCIFARGDSPRLGI